MKHRLRWFVALVVVPLIAATIAYAVARPETAREVSVSDAAARLDDAGGDRGDASTTTAPAGLPVPAEGVYRYRGEGTERLSRPPTSQAQGPDMPGTVTHLGGDCWRFRIDYSTKHHQSWDYCATDGRLVERGGAAHQLLDIVVTDVEVSSTTTCATQVVALDLAARPGATQDQSCSATSTGSEGSVTSSGPNRFVGRERIDVGGTSVDTLHYRRERTLAGGQHGTEALDLWFDARTGLPVQNRRQVSVVTPSPLGELTYSEDGSFTLTDVDPVG